MSPMKLSHGRKNSDDSFVFGGADEGMVSHGRWGRQEKRKETCVEVLVISALFVNLCLVVWLGPGRPGACPAA